MSSTRALPAALLLFALVAVAGCSGGRSEPIGSACTIQFRRDALGGAANLPVSPLTSEINGATVSLHGKLLRADAEWVVIERPEDTLWVPRASVLLLQIRKP